MRNKIIKAIASMLFVGYIPFAPGTWGSLCGVLIYLLVRSNFCLYLRTLALLLFLGFYTTGKAEKIFGKKDDQRIVIDEACAVFILLSLAPNSLFYMVISFILFRVLDIAKPYPAKRIQDIGGSLGIMVDDMIAAAYSYTIIILIYLTQNSIM